MNDFRAVLAIFISMISGYLIIDIFLNGFSWVLVFFAIIGFILVHLIWPKHRSSDSAWYESLQFIFDLPYQLIAYSIRGLGRLLKLGDIDI